jgi:hypothetical protein
MQDLLETKFKSSHLLQMLSTMLVICDVTLYNLGPQCTNDLTNAPCCFSASTPEGLHDDKLLLVERRHSVVLRDSLCLTQMNLKPKNSAQNEESFYRAVVIYAWIENLEHERKQRIVRIHPNYPIKFLSSFLNLREQTARYFKCCMYRNIY